MVKKYLIVLVIAIVLVVALNSRTAQPGASDTNQTKVADAATDSQWSALAQALTEADAKFYGAFWCSHCQDQKALFGDAIKDVPYVECAPDKSNPYQQAPVCKAAQIDGYPTWVFKTGVRVTNVMTFEQLSQQIGWSYNSAPSTN